MLRRTIMAAALATATVAGAANAGDTEHFRSVLSGFNEVGALNAESGAVLSEGHATLELKLDRTAQTLSYTLTFANLIAPVTQSHIHFGKVHVPGGVMVFLCTNLNNGPAGTPMCPAGGGSVSGTLTPASVIGPAAQHVTAGDFDALEDALESDTTYVNIHSTAFPAGEIRGEVRRADRDDQE